MRERRLAVVALAGFALLGLTSGATPSQPSSDLPSLEERVAALPPVGAPAVSEEVARVLAKLDRYQRRTGLTQRERIVLAERIVAEAHRHDLDPSLVMAVMHIESLYDTYAVSNKDAMGLMQILPSTGEWLAPQVGVQWRGPQSLFDPIVNVRIGTAYLRQLADRYDGDIAAALAAYNWGPGHIDGRIRRGVPLPTGYAHKVLEKFAPEV